jgi:XapX domain
MEPAAHLFGLPFIYKGCCVKELLFSSGVGFGIGAFFTLLRLPIPVPNVLPGILSIVFMYIGYLVVRFFMP